MIKLIATDMDGTLLTSSKQMPPELDSVVRALHARGVAFCIASGRQYASLRRDLKALVPYAVFIAENGALIMKDDRRMFIDALAGEDLPDIVRAAKGLHKVYPVVCRANGALVESTAAPDFIRSMQMYYEETVVVDDLAAACGGFDDVCKVAFYDDGDASQNALPVLKARLGGRFSVILSGMNWVDVMKPGVHKGRAIRALQEQLHISPDECMAFGDYLNDLEMLQAVTESYAMENALDELKRMARHIAPGCDDNGVMRVVKKRFSL